MVKGWVERLPSPFRQVVTYGGFGVLTLWFGNAAVVALMTGEAHGRRGAIYRRLDDPAWFWMELAIDAGIAGACLFALVRIAIRDAKGLSGS